MICVSRNLQGQVKLNDLTVGLTGTCLYFIRVDT